MPSGSGGKGGVCKVATPNPKAQIFCPRKQARIFFFLSLQCENDATEKRLPELPKN
jgi:hypothetical protein